MKIVLVGAGGQLAHELKRALREHELVALERAELDICVAEKVEQRLGELRPDLVVNAAAYNLVDLAESDPQPALAGNFVGPRNLAKACHRFDAVLAHFSTDYVFGLPADRDEPWTEDDRPVPLSAYGISKLAGEHAVIAYCPRHYVIRTCGLYGVRGSRGKGGNFVETMLRLGASGKPVRVVNDQICTPSHAGDVADTVADLLSTGRFGLYHVTNAGSCSWFELACEIYRQSAMQVECVPITSAEFNAAARRPSFSVLSNEKIRRLGLAGCAPWQDALARYLAART